MNVRKEKIHEDFDRMLYWARIYFSSQDNSKKTTILVAASYEYLEDFFKISGKNKVTDQHLTIWIENVIKKWSKLSDDIFKNKIHYDAYVSNPKYESNLVDYLVNNIKA